MLLKKKIVEMLTLHMYVLLMGYSNAGIAGDTSKDKGTLYLMTMSTVAI